MVTKIKMFFPEKWDKLEKRKQCYVNKKIHMKQREKNRLLHVDNVDN